MVLVDALGLNDEPGNEDAIEGVPEKLFRAPRVSVQAAAERYAEKFRTWGLASVPALELVSVQGLIAAGVPVGHALTLHATINVQQEEMTVAPVQQAVPIQHSTVRTAAVMWDTRPTRAGGRGIRILWRTKDPEWIR